MSIEEDEKAKAEEEEKAKAEEEERIKAEAKRAGILAECIKQWNVFIKGLMSARMGWERYRDVRTDENIQLEEFPLEVQKLFYLANPHGEFDLLVDELLTHPNVKEHLKTLLILIK